MSTLQHIHQICADRARLLPAGARRCGPDSASAVMAAQSAGAAVQVGPRVVLGWLAHYWALAAYTLLDAAARPLRGVKFLQRHRVQRWMDAWRWGAGQDSTHHAPAPA